MYQLIKGCGIEGRVFSFGFWSDPRQRGSVDVETIDRNLIVRYSTLVKRDILEFLDEDMLQERRASPSVFDSKHIIYSVPIKPEKFFPDELENVDIIKVEGDFYDSNSCSRALVAGAEDYFRKFLGEGHPRHGTDPGEILFGFGVPCIYLDKGLVVVDQTFWPFGDSCGEDFNIHMDGMYSNSDTHAKKLSFRLERSLFLPVIDRVTLKSPKVHARSFDVCYTHDLDNAFDFMHEMELWPVKYF